MRIYVLVLFLAVPGGLRAQVGRVPDSQCVYRLGDNPAWAAASVDPGGWQPYTAYRMTGDAWVLWVRCQFAIDSPVVQHPSLSVGSDGPVSQQAFVDGRPVASSIAFRIYPLPEDLAPGPHVVALRIVQRRLAPGLTPGRPAFLYLAGAPLAQAMAQASRGMSLKETVPAYSCFLVIGAAGLFLLGLFLFDRSQKAAFWLGIYCVAVCLTRINVMGHYLLWEKYSNWIQALFFGISGFTTCLCADLQFSGVLVIANAGQLPPYRNGTEIEIPASLPLGVEAGAEYAESTLPLAPGDRLTFISDGVVEARNTLGELFGFERTRQISSQTAQQIANEAVAFGQQDDITVLTVSLAPSAVMA